MSFESEITTVLLDSDQPAAGLRALLQNLLDSGVSTKDLYERLEPVKIKLAEELGDHVGDIMQDALDALSGYSSADRLRPRIKAVSDDSSVTEDQLWICGRYECIPVPTHESQTVSVAVNLNPDETLIGIRLLPTNEHSGWYIGNAHGRVLSDESYFHRQSPRYLLDNFPRIHAYLALPPYFRFFITKERETASLDYDAHISRAGADALSLGGAPIRRW